MPKPISIIIPAYNQLEYCKQCIASILLHTERQPCKLILVDNGSTDGVADYFDSIPGAVVVHAAENKGFAGGVNLGLAHAEGHVVVLNSDTIVPVGWLQRLEKALLQGDDIGMVGPMSNYVSGEQQIEGLELTSLEAINAFSDDLAQRCAGQLCITNRLVGFCILIRDTALAAVGDFDEGYGIGNYEDDDYCQRLVLAGYRLCRAEDCFVFHYGNRTFYGMGITGESWKDLIARNRRRFESKWISGMGMQPESAATARHKNAIAMLCILQADYESALKLYSEAIQIAPSDSKNYIDLGLLLLRIERVDNAYSAFQQALRCDPDHTLARSSFLRTAEQLSRTAEALAFLEGLKRVPPKR